MPTCCASKTFSCKPHIWAASKKSEPSTIPYSKCPTRLAMAGPGPSGWFHGWIYNKNAIEKIELFDLRLDRLPIMYFEMRGINLDKEHCYSLKEINKTLGTLFGESIAEKILDLIRDGIKAQYYKRF